MEGVVSEQFRDAVRITDSDGDDDDDDPKAPIPKGPLTRENTLPREVVENVDGSIQNIHASLVALLHEYQPREVLPPVPDHLDPPYPLSKSTELGPLHEDLETTIGRLHEVLEDHRMEVMRGRSVNESLETQLAQYRSANDILSRQLGENKTKLASYQKLMLRAGRKEERLMDSEIQAKFVTLKNDILNLVKHHFTRFVMPKGGFRPTASPDITELLIRAKVARQLYLAFFGPTIKLFGIEDDRDNNLLKWMEDHVSSRRTHDDELIEWRATTVRLAKLLVGGSLQQAKYPSLMTDRIWVEIKPHCHHPQKTDARDQANYDLEALCYKAFELSLLFRETKVEYEWDQDVERLQSFNTSPQEHEILGTMGPGVDEPHQIHRIVFGGVVRGDKSTGRLKDGRTRLFPSSVVITEQLPLR